MFLSASAKDEPAVRVVDGDTIEMYGEIVRLWGIDAVEDGQKCVFEDHDWNCGKDATAALELLVLGHPVHCVPQDVDRYGRTVAVCYVNGVDLGSVMVRHGWALDYTKYSYGSYAGWELLARQDGSGVWSGCFVEPWKWREAKRKKRVADPVCFDSEP